MLNSFKIIALLFVSCITFQLSSLQVEVTNKSNQHVLIYMYLSQWYCCSITPITKLLEIPENHTYYFNNKFTKNVGIFFIINKDNNESTAFYEFNSDQKFNIIIDSEIYIYSEDTLIKKFHLDR